MRPRLFAFESLEKRSLFSAGYAFQTIASLGDAIPNPAGGTFTSDFEPGVLNNRGQLVFTSEQSPAPNVDNGEGVFLTGRNGSGPITALSFPGEAAPGGGGAFGGFGTWSRDALNNNGDAAFSATLLPSPTGFPGYGGTYRYSAKTGNVTPVVVPGVTDAPTGGKFAGTYFHPSLNDRGALAFVGVIPTTQGFAPQTGLGEGVFEAYKNGQIVTLVAPGDPAPGGTFDSFQDTSINSRGDVAFGAHRAGDPSLGSDILGLGSFQSVYFRRADGTIQSIAHQGDLIPGSHQPGAVFDTAFSPVVNDNGQIAFQGSIGVQPGNTDTNNDKVGIFFFSHGKLVTVAQPGDAMPGGGVFDTASSTGAQIYLNNGGDVVFGARLTNGDQGVYVLSHGSLRLVAKTGTPMPGGKSLGSLNQFGVDAPFDILAWASINDRGQVAFAAVLNDDSISTFLATPIGDKGIASAVPIWDTGALGTINNDGLVHSGTGEADSLGIDGLVLGIGNSKVL